MTEVEPPPSRAPIPGGSAESEPTAPGTAIHEGPPRGDRTERAREAAETESPTNAAPANGRRRDGTPPDTERSGPADVDSTSRLALFAYLGARDYRRTYLAIMRLFAGTLLADLSAGEVAGALAGAERAGLIDPGEHHVDTVISRLRQLVEWGNLVHGRRETVAASIAEFQHGSVRYQVSKLAVRVQRDVDELLAVPEGAREVSRELLPAIERGLRALGTTLSEALAAEHGGAGSRRLHDRRELLAEQVTTLFLQHAELAATVRDFYAYLGQVVTRHQLDSEELSGFRDLLVDYIQMVVEDVLRHTPNIGGLLARLARSRGELLRLLGPLDGWDAGLERSRGRSASDWRELTDWFVDRAGRPSQVTALRDATARAIGTLLAGVKRATAGAGTLPGRRAELLRLAAWFDASDRDQAARLYAAAFGLYSARNLLPPPEHDGDDEHTPWRDGPVIDVSVSVRSRADRGARGRTSRVVFDPITEQTLLAQARHDARAHQAAVDEVIAAAPDLTAARLSPAALRVVCDLLTLAMASRDSTQDASSVSDPVHGLRLTVTPMPGRHTTLTGTSGALTLHDTVVTLAAGDGDHGRSAEAAENRTRAGERTPVRAGAAGRPRAARPDAPVDAPPARAGASRRPEPQAATQAEAADLTDPSDGICAAKAAAPVSAAESRVLPAGAGRQAPDRVGPAPAGFDPGESERAGSEQGDPEQVGVGVDGPDLGGAGHGGSERAGIGRGEPMLGRTAAGRDEPSPTSPDQTDSARPDSVQHEPARNSATTAAAAPESGGVARTSASATAGVENRSTIDGPHPPSSATDRPTSEARR
ncbi:uncharacterized protein (TIGR02677 family) [Actinoalloteichus hoggarensis]|uniref:Uncharacterized protein n=1 Tax=Actinoalloteichus hoggarensis TaxID=1470176 RepID=A0A221W8M4_9PSEU|nr:DUF2397 domain-containing protein [Actinoalloteichus hoggarensis]ASO22255.1 hypothetical protein AHOG_23230 [Actinoalloteichus hoggarensis]MBB5923325.1 uncharacterized protein (TIGR02677 family) [Actinoalloteichus hoggarensis]